MDWDNDGKVDLLAGDASGKITFFKNIGTKEKPVLAAGVPVESDGKPIVGVHSEYEQDKDGNWRAKPNDKDVIGVYSKINVCDWNGDGLKDLIVGQDGPGGQKLVVYINIGTASAPKFGPPQVVTLPAPAMSRPSPFWVDWDGDGKPDLIMGTESAAVYFFRNIGTREKPAFAKGELLNLKGEGFDKGCRCRCWVTDWNNDGKLDILVGNFSSGADRQSGGNVWLFLGK